MKSFLLTLIACVGLLFNVAASADKITITGEPVVITEDNGVFVPATTVTDTQDYYYFTMGDAKRVCYKDANPSLVNVTATPVKVRVGTNVVTLQCYDYNTDYFVVQ